MLKAKDYDWKDSNMATFGTSQDRDVKKSSALTEEAWKDSGKSVGTEIWRINKFKVERWPVEDYGKFFNGDSYIILHTYKENDSDELLMDVHFWIGKHSTQDEYGTAAYKTVELDTYHDDKPIQHREVQGNESQLFKSYFPTITIMKGGCDTGFNRVKPTEYKQRLFQIVGERRNIEVIEIPMKSGNVNSDDVFIFDLGLTVYQLNGKNANKDEKYKATQYVQMIKSDRMGKVRVEVLEEEDVPRSHPIYSLLREGRSRRDAPADNRKGMYRISDDSGQLLFSEVLSGRVDKSLLDSGDVFLIDVGNHLFVWIGEGASINERKNALGYAHTYLKDKSNPFCPVTCLNEKQASKSKDFIDAFR